MPPRRVVNYYKGSLQGSFLSTSDCDKLDKILALQEMNGSLPDLVNVITDLTPDQREELTRTGEISGDIDLGTLRDYQTISVAYAYWAKRCLLGASVGLGKTVIIAGLVNLLTAAAEKEGRQFSFLFLGDKNTLKELHDSLTRFSGKRLYTVTGEAASNKKFFSVVSLHDRPNVVGNHALVSQNLFYEEVRKYREETGENPFDLIVIDEASEVGKATGSFGQVTSQKYKNLQWLTSDAERVVSLNATPFEANLMTFFHQLQLLDPSFLPTKTAFNNRYAVMKYQGRGYAEPTGEYQNAEEFRRLIKYRYLPQTRKSLGATVTDSSAELLVAPLTAIQKSLASKVSMPQMLWDCPWYFDSSLPRTEESTGKLAALEKALDEALQTHETVLVYCHFKEAQLGVKEFLYDLGYTSEILNGDQDYETKQLVISAFKEEKFQVLITNVQKGLNFGHCKRLVFYSKSANTNTMVQIEGRVTRDLDIEGVKVWVIVAEGAEHKSFKKQMVDHAKASRDFAGRDHSLVLDLLAAEESKRTSADTTPVSETRQGIMVLED